MADETILCHQCGKDLVMKFIELKDLVFCSSSCFESFKNTMSSKDFFKNYGDAFTPDEQVGSQICKRLYQDVRLLSQKACRDLP